MTDADLLSKVKIRLGITGEYQDDLLTGYIEDVKNFLADAGVPIEVITSEASVGVIARGVSDSWNFGSGDGRFSRMFFQRAEQLRRVIPDAVPENDDETDGEVLNYE